MRAYYWILLLLGISVVPAAGQANPDSILHRNECRRALQIVRTGHPAAQREWAQEYVRRCRAEAGQALAAAIRSSRHESNPVALEQATRPTLYLIDGNVFEAASEVAQDRTASEPARVLALRALVVVALPNATPNYAEMTGKDLYGSACIGGYSTHDLTETGAALPAGAYQRSHALATAIVRDTTASQEVREAARCLVWLAGRRVAEGER